MKRILSLALLLCVAATLFAASGLTVKAGGAFDVFSLKTDKRDGDDVFFTFKGNGLGLELGVQYAFSDKIMVYTDCSAVFPADFAMYESDDEDPILFSKEVEILESEAKELKGGKATHFCIFLDAAIGAAYRFDFGSIKLAVGGGVYCNWLFAPLRLTGTYGDEAVDEKTVWSFFTVGVSTLVEARYMVADKVGISLTVQPQIGIYSDRKLELYEHGEIQDPVYDLTGVGISFTVPVSIGASYSF